VTKQQEKEKRNVITPNNPLVEEEKHEKTPVFVISRPMLTTVEQDNFPVKLSGPGHLGGSITGQVLSKPKEVCQSDKKTPGCDIRSEEKNLDQSIMEKHNPNERGRASIAPITSLTSCDTSLVQTTAIHEAKDSLESTGKTVRESNSDVVKGSH